LARDLSQAEPHVRADIPEWLVGSFERAFGNEWEAEAQAMTARPPLDLRVNTLQTDRDQVAGSLCRTGVPGQPGWRRSASGLKPAKDPSARSLHKRSQLRPRLVRDPGRGLATGSRTLRVPRPAKKVLDYCAGGGGKSLAFAAMMKNEGSINAYDADRRRLAPMVERIRRAGAEIIYIKERAADLAGLEGQAWTGC
jgi:16S rRNA (cytosine967-C5)-methyltransferase